ncbi:hypothetical protein DOTSEDRAFT_51541 [Dothistroma septosporum NZE10]|uniref:beta-glucosidase n=1 Tax=Dothistroma septosporum (strain NZE10 / CBS 128990) TaxID=675120 RepID=N1PRB3_DOTSN|nr:hypothetical protein DOTSEDRAFT_51541 [Dothistroma septosporum NZE10]
MKIVSTGQQKSGLLSFLEHIGLPLLCLFMVALFTGLFFDLYCPNYSYTNSLDAYGFSCAADGTVVYPLEGSANQCWNPTLFVSITLAFGRLTFPQAKAIDICWDLVVGRGGQMLLSIWAYSVIRKSLLAILEKRPLRMPLVTSLTFEHFSMWSWYALVRDLTFSWSWRLFGYLYVVVYLLAFGTLVSAMTGYQANMAPFYRADGNLMEYSKVKVVPASIVLDADRVGLESVVTVWGSESDPNYPLWNYTALAATYCQGSGLLGYAGDRNNGTLHSNDTSYSDWYGAYTDTEVQSVLFSIDWALNQTMTYARMGDVGMQESSARFIDCTTSNITIANHTHSLPWPPLSFQRRNPLYLDENGKILDEDWLHDKQVSSCQTLETYQWGFASLLLFTFCIFTIIFLCVLLALSVDVWLNSQVNRMEQSFSLYRDILDYASEIRAELGEQVEGMSPKELQSSMDALKAEASISAYEYPPTRAQIWRKQHKPRLEKFGSELRARHAYSMAGSMRSWGLSYGPVRKTSTFEDFDDDQLGEEFRSKGAHVILGPVAAPLGRSAYGGKNWLGAVGILLLKNQNNTLPLKKPKNIGIFGNGAGDVTEGLYTLSISDIRDFGYQKGVLLVGGGFGTGRLSYVISPPEVIKARAAQQKNHALVQYVLDNDLMTHDDGSRVWLLLYDNNFYPRPPEVCLVSLKTWATEGADRTSLPVDWNGTAVVETVAAQCANTVVTTNSGGLNVLPFADHPNMLWGEVNPSGHLPYTIAHEQSDYDFAPITMSIALQNTSDPLAWESEFEERLLIDYRWFDDFNASVRFDFGYGLSYTAFPLANLNIFKTATGTLSPTPPAQKIAPGGNPALLEQSTKSQQQ